MSKSGFLRVFVFLVLPVFPMSLHAQTAAPTAYTLTQVSSLFVPGINMTYYQAGTKVLLEQSYGPREGNMKGFHVRTYTDLATNTNYTWDLIETAGGCAPQKISGDWGDPFVISAALLGDMAKQNPKQTGTETINGISTKVMEATTSDAKVKAWVDVKYGLLIRLEMTPPTGATRTMIEVKKLTIGAPPASIFRLPSTCTTP